MASALALVGAGVRARSRSRVAAFCAVAGLVAIALAVFASAGGAGDPAPVAVDAVLLAVGVLVGLAAAGAGTDLPAARALGAEEWLAAAAPSGAGRRLARAGSAALSTLAAGTLAVGAALALLVVSGRLVDTRAVAALPLPAAAPARLAADRPSALDLTLPADGRAERAALELDLRPIWRDLDAAAVGRCALVVRVDGGASFCPTDVPERGTWRLALPAGASRVRVEAADAAVDVVVERARLVGPPRSAAGNVLFAGLLVTLGIACAVPFAVLLSRVVSGGAAATATALLLLVGIAHGPLLELAADVRPRHAWPSAVLWTTARLAPDLSGLSVVGEAARGRGIPAAAVLGLWPALAHASLCLLALVPGRRTTG